MILPVWHKPPPSITSNSTVTLEVHLVRSYIIRILSLLSTPNVYTKSVVVTHSLSTLEPQTTLVRSFLLSHSSHGPCLGTLGTTSLFFNQSLPLPPRLQLPFCQPVPPSTDFSLMKPSGSAHLENSRPQVLVGPVSPLWLQRWFLCF